LDNTRHLVRLLNDLLDLARSDAGRLTIKPTPTDVASLVEDPVRTIASQTAAKGQTLNQQIEPGLPQVNVDKDRIRQRLVNLRANGHEYCRSGVTIQVTADGRGDGGELSVADNGPGMAADQLEHIFERFARGDAGLTRHVGGPGIGLAISKS